MAKTKFVNTMDEPAHPPEHVSAASGSFRGNSLLMLLNLPVDARVLVIGDRLESWRDDFRNCSFHGRVPGHSTDRKTFDLAMYHSGSAASTIEFDTDLKQLRDCTSPGGALLLFAENRYSLAGLKKIRRGRPDPNHGGTRLGYSGYRKMLIKGGFKAVRGFVPMPGLEVMEELWAADSSAIEIPHYCHPLQHLAQAFGCFRQIADGYLFVASATAIEEEDLFQTISRTLTGPEVTSKERYLLERVDMRSRGAMVLFITGSISTERFIVRVVSDIKTDRIIGKNHGFVQFLRDLPGLPNELKGLLPCPIRRLEHDGSVVYIESMLEGVPAWKVIKSGLRERIFRGSVEFITEVNRFTKQPILLDDREINRIFEEDLRCIYGCEVMNAHFRSDMLEIIGKLGALLNHSEQVLVSSHGDYGYGNILVDGKSGVLKGVIDWDTGKSADMPGVDLFNLYVQTARTENNWGLLQAFRAVAPGFISSCGDDHLNTFFDDFRIGGDIRKIVVYLGFIRFVSRSAQYPDVFIQEQGEFLSILDMLRGTFPL